MKILRSDDAKEYFISSFTNFMTEHDIIHQSSSAYTSQQDGFVEHKNLSFAWSYSHIAYSADNSYPKYF